MPARPQQESSKNPASAQQESSKDLARSSKRIRYFADTDSWEVYHEIDEIEEFFPSTEKMLELTNLGIALERGALYQYDYSKSI